jgi:hypothetical protein
MKSRRRLLPPEPTTPPRSPRPYQFGARLTQFRLKPRPVGVQFGVAVSHGLHFREHGGHITGHANLIGPGVPEQRRF